jgi:hypothetical protein
MVPNPGHPTLGKLKQEDEEFKTSLSCNKNSKIQKAKVQKYFPVRWGYIRWKSLY